MYRLYREIKFIPNKTKKTKQFKACHRHLWPPGIFDQGTAIVLVLSEIFHIFTTWSHNCCEFRGGLFPYLNILPSLSLAHICSTTFKLGELGGQGISSISGLLENHLSTLMLQWTVWLSCWKIKFPSGFQIRGEGRIAFSKICTNFGCGCALAGIRQRETSSPSMRC